MAKFLSREDILSVQDAQTREVDIPEWGGTVRVRGLTGAERDRYEASLWEGRGRGRRLNLENARAKLLVLTLVDESGAPLFTRQDVDRLGAKSAAALDRLFDVAQELSGISNTDMDELIEETAKNSGNGQGDSLLSA